MGSFDSLNLRKIWDCQTFYQCKKTLTRCRSFSHSINNNYPDVVNCRKNQQDTVEILRKLTNQVTFVYYVIVWINLQSFPQRSVKKWLLVRARKPREIIREEARMFCGTWKVVAVEAKLVRCLLLILLRVQGLLQKTKARLWTRRLGGRTSFVSLLSRSSPRRMVMMLFCSERTKGLF